MTTPENRSVEELMQLIGDYCTALMAHKARPGEISTALSDALAVQVRAYAAALAVKAEPTSDAQAATVSAQWRAKGEPDPHGTSYDCERAALTLGQMTDDELANAVFMHGDGPLDIEACLARKPGYHPPIAYLTAAKDRIRWLSRKLDAALAAVPAVVQPPPIDMVLYCPKCHMQHIDAPNRLQKIVHVGSGTVVDELWTNPPHRSHLCHGCGYIWRPADVPTNGVAAVKTKGKSDSPVDLTSHSGEAATAQRNARGTAGTGAHGTAGKEGLT